MVDSWLSFQSVDADSDAGDPGLEDAVDNVLSSLDPEDVELDLVRIGWTIVLPDDCVESSSGEESDELESSSESN